jgi:hypothetical protein
MDERGHPCLTLCDISVLFSEGLCLIFTFIFVDLRMFCMTLTKCCGMSFLIRISHSLGLSTLSNTFSKSTKAVNVGILNSLCFYVI